MNLVVDIGNSRIKWSPLGDGSWCPGRSAALEEGLARLLDRSWKDMDPPGRVLVANVAGKPVSECVAAWTREHWHVEAEFFKSTARFGDIVSEYAHPPQLGCDRWAAIIGARALADGALCVVDCGTATTIDALTADHRFIGGVIFPGVELIQRSLLTGTAEIKERRDGFKEVFGTSTAECVSGGSFIGAAGAIDRVLDEMSVVLDQPVLYITGGDARSVLPLLRHPCRHEPDLVLKGLARVLRSTEAETGAETV